MESTVQVEVYLAHETEDAVLVKDDEDAEPVWLPKSQIEIEPNGSTHILTAPEDLLIEKGFI